MLCERGTVYVKEAVIEEARKGGRETEREKTITRESGGRRGEGG
jgi:hypothetical protein